MTTTTLTTLARRLLNHLRAEEADAPRSATSGLDAAQLAAATRELRECGYAEGEDGALRLTPEGKRAQR
jgi:hypothetical protein